MRNFKIGNHTIGSGQVPYIIAEMSGNHNQSIDRAFQIIDAAADAGAHAVKLQTYTPDTMTMKGAYTIEDPNSLWHGRELYDLYKEAHTPWEWHKPIFDYARNKGIEIFSTPFDETAVDFLMELDVAAFKVASFENTDLPLLRKVAQTGKPVIISTGAATLSQIDEAVNTLRNEGCDDLVILKCTSTYPASPENTNLLTIPNMRETFGVHVGLSDHTMGIGASIASIALGAVLVEKHFTLSRADGGVDSAFSIEPDELKNLVIEGERAFFALGYVQYGVQKDETKSLVFKRSLYASQDISSGDILTYDNVRVIRPGFGLAPKYLDLAMGKTVKKAVTKGSPITWDIIL